MRIAKEIFRKMSISLIYLLNRDNITYQKIISRKDLKKVGTNYGGWVIPMKELNRNSICYCVGCGEDISFDLGLIEEFNSEVFGFDPTPRAIKWVKEHTKQYEKYHFYDIGLWDKSAILKFYSPKNQKHVSHSILNLQKTGDYFEGKVKSLKDVMQENNHNKLDLLKLDVEGAEYRIINSIIKDNINIKILCVEYDEYFNSLDINYKSRIKESLASLIKFGYSLVYSDGCANYTLVKKKSSS